MYEKLGKALMKGFIMLFVVIPSLNSCFDDSELWEKIESIEARLDSLETSLNGQLKAFNDFMVSQEVTISSCVQKADGSYGLTLSNGTVFTMLPDSTSFSNIVSYIEESGVKYWAVCDPSGNLTPMLGSDGKKIPVMADTPVVEERDGVYYLTVGGNEYVTGFNTEDFVSIFTSYTINKDDLGQMHSATFIFGEDLSFTVSLDGYTGFAFLDNSGEKTTEYYVAYGKTVDIMLETVGVTDFVVQAPEGWKVREKVEAFDGTRYISVTAPEKAAAVEFGEGMLKVVAVLEGGKAAASSLRLTTNPFKALAATATKVVVENCVGVDKFVYGLCAKSEFEAGVYSAASDALAGTETDGVAVAEARIAVDYADISQKDLVVGEDYVLWAIPVHCTYIGEVTETLHAEETLVSIGFTHVDVEISNVVPTFDDADISVNMEGVTSYYAGTALAEETLISDIIDKINSGRIAPFSDGFDYAGSAFTYPSAEANAGILMNPGSTYCTWIVPVREGRSVYVEEDVIKAEFTLKLIEKGGKADLAEKSSSTDCVSIVVDLEAEGAKQIYYAFMTERNASRYPDNDLKAEYLLKNGTMVAVSDDTKPVRIVMGELKPETTMALLAVAVDKDGKYGKAMQKSYKTKAIEFNTIRLKVNPSDIKDKSAQLQLSYTGGIPEEYVYWVASVNHKDWLTTFDANMANVQNYMALSEDPLSDPLLYDSMTTHSVEGDVLTLRNLYPGTQYKVIVIAKDKNGVPSKYAYCDIVTMTVNLGTIVTADNQAWKSAKAAVEIKWHHDKFYVGGESAFYAFDITVPKDLTAYIWCISDAYFQENTSTQTVPQKIVDIEKYCSRKYDAGVVASKDGMLMQEPDWQDDNGKVQTGHLMNVYSFYVHGYPKNGFATYFASGTHDESTCTSWEEGHCFNYQYALDAIAKRVDPSYEYYKQYVKNNRGSYCTKEEVIDKAAKDLYEAYLPYYENAEPLVYINEGAPLYMEQHYGAGPDDNGSVVDDVYIVFKDKDGNYYEPMSFQVPNSFKTLN